MSQSATVSGIIPSFVMPPNYFFGPGGPEPVAMDGSRQFGVPSAAAVANMTDTNPGTNTVKANLQYGQKTAMMPTWSNPILWTIIVGVVSVVMIAHVAKVEVE